MRVIRGRHNIQKQDHGCVVTIGNFDGVHLGHQAILQRVNAAAEQFGCPSLLICFEPQPKEFFEAFKAPARLTRFREKVEHLKAAGLDRLLCLPFNDATQSLSVAEFITMLTDDLKVQALFVGDDFRFGADRSGDYAALEAAGTSAGFEVANFYTITHGAERISSTRIRTCLSSGNFREAEALLGRRYTITGRVVYGRQIGRTIGVPTANIQLHRYKAPLSGVYLVQACVGDDRYWAVANVGVRPTVVPGMPQPILEVHILDFEGDLYGRQADIQFLEKLRDEQKFSGLEELRAAIGRDIETARSRIEEL